MEKSYTARIRKAGEGMSDIEHEYTREIVCPHCGCKHNDSYEYFSDGSSEEEVEVDCDCGETFFAIRKVSVNYSTRKKESK